MSSFMLQYSSIILPLSVIVRLIHLNLIYHSVLIKFKNCAVIGGYLKFFSYLQIRLNYRRTEDIKITLGNDLRYSSSQV